ncbi:MAG TPA: hypothetical protein VKB65_08925 [Myxococcota bacterium]|nr:hypothetical protein [Myxococcota bacterium]
MKHAGLLALAICLLLPASADARKRCRSDEAAAPSSAAEAPEDSASSLHWARGNDSSWVHDADESWYHHRAAEDVAAPAPAASVAYDPNEGNGWVHETDYGWWAGVDADEATDVENEDGRFTETEEDCTVSKDRNECVVLANQVATYRFRLGLAQERGDALWAESLQLTIDRLDARAERRGCPWAIEPTIKEQIVETMKKVIEAGIVAARVYSMIYRAGLL